VSEEVEQDLVAAIAADPDAIEPRLVYGDFLQAMADPRGELIAVQAALLAKPGALELLARERELTAELTRKLFDGTTLYSGLVVRWHLGFVDALSLDARTIRVLRTTHRAWFAQTAFACVRDIDITSKYARTLRSIAQLELSAVRRLSFGELGDVLPEPTLAAIASRLPHLTALHLRGSEVPDFAPLRALRLRELALQIPNLGDAGIARLVAAPWALETLGLTTVNPVAEDVYPVLATLFTGRHLPSVKHFAVGGGVPVMVAIDAIATSGHPVASLTGDFHRAPREALMQAERHRKALAHVQFKPVLGASDYYDVEGLAAVGSFLSYQLDRTAEAIPYYERALQLKPEHSLTRHHLGIALRKVRRLDESLVAFDMLIAQSKKPTATMFNGRHYTLCELGRRAEAIADLERAVSLEPNYADAWNNLGVERQYTGDVDGAFAAFRRCTELNPQHNHALRNEGDLLLELGRAREALLVYERLRAEKGPNPALLAMIAHARVVAGDAAGARALLDEQLADPVQARDSRLYVLRALALRAVGDPSGARGDLDTLANMTAEPAWYAVTLFVRALDDHALWRQAVPDHAVTPRAIADAVIAHAGHGRPAKPLGDANLDQQMDCSELAIAAALLAGDRGLAVQRARAVVMLYVEQGPRYLRKWWQLIATVAAVVQRDLDDDARALLQMVMRAVRGRHRVADVMALAN
jgi:uncharacterized protein (TIGR02996 family)